MFANNLVYTSKKRILHKLFSSNWNLWLLILTQKKKINKNFTKMIFVDWSKHYQTFIRNPADCKHWYSLLYNYILGNKIQSSNRTEN